MFAEYLFWQSGQRHDLTAGINPQLLGVGWVALSIGNTQQRLFKKSEWVTLHPSWFQIPCKLWEIFPGILGHRLPQPKNIQITTQESLVVNFMHLISHAPTGKRADKSKDRRKWPALEVLRLHAIPTYACSIGASIPLSRLSNWVTSYYRNLAGYKIIIITIIIIGYINKSASPRLLTVY